MAKRICAQAEKSSYVKGRCSRAISESIYTDSRSQRVCEYYGLRVCIRACKK